MDQRPTFWTTPGTTVCLDCAALITTPANIIPGDWLTQHSGHRISIQLAIGFASEPTIPANFYQCAQCGKVFEKARSDDDALEDSRRKWGEIPAAEQAVICDDCYRVLMANFN